LGAEGSNGSHDLVNAARSSSSLTSSGIGVRVGNPAAVRPGRGCGACSAGDAEPFVAAFPELPAEPPFELPEGPPAEPPIESPAEPAIELPTESPAEPAIELPIESPAEPAIELPTESPFEPPIELPAEPIVEAPVEPVVDAEPVAAESSVNAEPPLHALSLVDCESSVAGQSVPGVRLLTPVGPLRTAPNTLVASSGARVPLGRAALRSAPQTMHEPVGSSYG
jgi:hypothetical protein